MTPTPPFYYLGNARSQKQFKEMVALEAAGICIFCPEHYNWDQQPQVLLEFAGGTSYKKRVLGATDTWVALENEYPYTGTKPHLLMVPMEHVTMKHQLSPASRAGYWEMLDLLVAQFGLVECYGEGSRNGDMSRMGATIAHHHIHLLAPDPNHDHRTAPIRLFLSSQPNHPSSDTS